MSKPYFTISYQDENYIRIVGSEYEIEMDLYEFFTYKAVNYQHHPKYKLGIWNGDMRLYRIRDKTLYIGLLSRFDDFCQARGYEWYLDSSFPDRTPLPHDDESIAKFISGLNLPEDRTPRDYQIEGLKLALCNERNILLSPTSSGKSLMMYMIARAIDRPTLIVVPTIQLVSQLSGDFSDYSNGSVVPQQIMAGKSKDVVGDIVVSTWQSLQHMPKEWFSAFDVIIGDEAHTFQAGALVKIMENTKSIRWKIGTTGTLSDEKVHTLVLEGLFGPRVVLQTTKELMDRGYATKLKIKCVLFKHSKDAFKAYLKDKKITGGHSYNDEIEYLIQNETRNEKIAKIATGLPGTTLVLCMRKEGHAIPLCDLIKTMTNKQVHLVTGDTKIEHREGVREAIATGEGDHIIVATYGTFKVGINIPRIDNLVLAHPMKAKITLLQSIGRILRKSTGKNIARTVDIGDQLVYTKNKNFTYLHMENRIQIYDREGFDWSSLAMEI